MFRPKHTALLAGVVTTMALGGAGRCDRRRRRQLDQQVVGRDHDSHDDHTVELIALRSRQQRHLTSDRPPAPTSGAGGCQPLPALRHHLDGDLVELDAGATATT